MSWNIGFSKNLFLNLNNKLGFSHIALQKKTQKISLTVIDHKTTLLAEFGRRLTNIHFSGLCIMVKKTK